jgi:hypothetical protein
VFIITISYVPTVGSIEPSDDYHFENVKVLAFGRSNTISAQGDLKLPYHQGEIGYLGVIVSGWLEHADFIVYNETLLDPYLVFKDVTDCSIHLYEANVTFLWLCNPYSYYWPLPPIFILGGYAENVHIELFG